MNDNFRFTALNAKHKKWFIIHQISLLALIGIMVYIAVLKTNPNIVESSDKISLTIGGSLGLMIFILAFFNRLKNLLKIKFIVFLITWVLLFSLQMIMTTLIWTIGLVLIPLMIDDLFLIPLWKNLWYNVYER